MRDRNRTTRLLLIFVLVIVLLSGASAIAESSQDTGAAVRFDLSLDSYVPQKDHYNFYFTYKTVHA